MIVSSLTCHAHVNMAITCLDSVRRGCQQEVTFHIHDDGSLTGEDVNRLEAHLSPCRIIRREEADERLMGILRKYPALRRLRNTYPPALKLFDGPLLCDEDLYRFCDSDVLFLRLAGNAFQLPDVDGVNALFMQDRKNGYSLRSWQKAMSRRVVLPEQVNVGLITFDLDSYNPDYLHWFVTRKGHRGIPWVLEQTAWAALGKRVGCRTYDPQQVRVMRENEDDGGLVAGHFTARTRHLLSRFAEKSQRLREAGEPVMLRTVVPGECTALDLARYELRRLYDRVCDGRYHV